MWGTFFALAAIFPDWWASSEVMDIAGCGGRPTGLAALSQVCAIAASPSEPFYVEALRVASLVDALLSLQDGRTMLQR